MGPIQTNSQNVNVIVSPLTKDRSFEIIADKSNYEKREIELDKSSIDTERLKTPLDDAVDIEVNNVVDRDIESAKRSLEEYKELIKDKDNLIDLFL